MRKYWLYIEPYVYIDILNDKSQAMLYNTLNKKHFVVSDKETFMLVETLCLEQNLRVIQISQEQNQLPLIKWLRNTYSGDVINVENSAKRPVQFVPELKIKNNIKTTNIVTPYQSIYELSLYLTGKCSSNCIFCNNYYKQFLYCRANIKKELSLEGIKNFFCQLNNETILQINFLGGELLSYSYLNSLLLFFANHKSIKNFIFNIRQIRTIHDFDIFEHYKNNLKITILINTFDKNYIYTLNSVINHLESIGIRCEVLFVIENEKEYSLIKNLHLKQNDKIFPFYNSQDNAFYRNNVFMREQDILNSDNKFIDILRNKTINKNFYGKLIIDTDGSIYTSFNTEKIGVMTDDINIILQQLVSKNSLYNLTRMKVYPCSGCIYRSLCPPISNFELFTKKNDLCFIQSD